jgi:hypothetical protein
MSVGPAIPAQSHTSPPFQPIPAHSIPVPPSPAQSIPVQPIPTHPRHSSPVQPSPAQSSPVQPSPTHPRHPRHSHTSPPIPAHPRRRASRASRGFRGFPQIPPKANFLPQNRQTHSRSPSPYQHAHLPRAQGGAQLCVPQVRSRTRPRDSLGHIPALHRRHSLDVGGGDERPPPHRHLSAVRSHAIRRVRGRGAGGGELVPLFRID